jgi:signal transduction histidine kinase/CheY-like chemotaxis protein
MEFDANELLRLAPVAVVVIDSATSRISIANRAWRELFGYAGPEDVPIADLGVFPAALLDEVRRVSLSGESSYISEAGNYGARHFSASLRAITDDECTRGVMVVCRDITSDLAKRREQERTAQLKDQFLAKISHELRAPLTTLVIWERLLRDTSADPRARDRALEAIHESVEQQSRLVSDLLEVSRAMTGKLRVDLIPMDLAPVLHRAIEEAALQSVGVELTSHVNGVGFVLGDALRLLQVFRNILSNALKFTPPGGTITITTTRARDELVVAVRDTGRGIQPSRLPYIFEPFEQAHDVTAGDPGLGLGLAITREIVTLHGGTVTAASDGSGRGSTIEVRIPCVRGTRPHATQPAVTPPVALSDIHVLVVDDDARVLNALRILLERAGAQVCCAKSAAVALASLDRDPIDIVVSDLAMPDEDGLELIHRIRALSSTVPAIALTGHHEASDRALAAGFDMCLAKPIDCDALILNIADLVATKH